MKNKDAKIAIVYDWIDKWGGVERLLLALNQIFPQADFYSSYYDPKKASWAKNLSIKTSFIQTLPQFIKQNRILSLIFYPIAFETFDFKNYDLVISITSSFAKGIITHPKTKHICYLFTPTRFLWVRPEEYYQIKGIKKFISQPLINYLLQWDKMASWRPDKVISISKTVRERCLNFYQRESTVIYPPFDFDYWTKIENRVSKKRKIDLNLEKIAKKSYYLIVSRLEPYKKIDLAIRVFNQLKKPLLIVGEGSEEKKLKRLSASNIIFLKKLKDEQLGYLYQHALALIMPQEEDFGYTALEAIFFKLPVITFGKGGATEIIEDGKTGIFFSEQKEKFLIEAIERLEKIRYNLIVNLNKVKKNNKYWARFSKQKFAEEFKETIFSL